MSAAQQAAHMTCTRPQAESQKNPLTRGRRPHMTQSERRIVVGLKLNALVKAIQMEPQSRPSTTDFSGSIRKIQINAPVTSTAAVTKNGAIQEPC